MPSKKKANRKKVKSWQYSHLSIESNSSRKDKKNGQQADHWLSIQQISHIHWKSEECTALRKAFNDRIMKSWSKKRGFWLGINFWFWCCVKSTNRIGIREFFAQNPKLETGPEGQKLKVLSSRYRKWRTQPVYGVASTSQFLFLLCGDAYKSLICVLQTTNLASQENTWWNILQ